MQYTDNVLLMMLEQELAEMKDLRVFEKRWMFQTGMGQKILVHRGGKYTSHRTLRSGFKCADHAVSLPGSGFRRFQLGYAVSICAVVR